MQSILEWMLCFFIVKTVNVDGYPFPRARQLDFAPGQQIDVLLYHAPVPFPNIQNSFASPLSGLLFCIFGQNFNFFAERTCIVRLFLL